MQKQEIAICWFRRDLRLHDHAALHHALSENLRVLPVFIFDRNILDRLEDRSDKRVDFIHQTLSRLNQQLQNTGSSFFTFYGTPEEAFEHLLQQYRISRVYTNHDYEPYALERDARIAKILSRNNIDFKTYKDQCIFEKKEICKDDGLPYTVFTPYSVKWKKTLRMADYEAYETEHLSANFLKTKSLKMPSLEEMNFSPTGISAAVPVVDEDLLRRYREQRDVPAIAGTTRLSVHLRFGTVSIRQLVKRALKTSETWLNELIWRDFYMMILANFPHAATGSFKKNYDQIPWRNNEAEFAKWCAGQTGFPIVDAGMRELNETGFMHNRVRMIVSSFLVKDLLVDWRWGEAYFASKLLDFDLSANNGGWQWAAGSGCDAAPYFRVFNPAEQQKKFDPHFKYIKKWVPEFGTKDYPLPIVDHAAARLRALATYKAALQESRQINLF